MNSRKKKGWGKKLAGEGKWSPIFQKVVAAPLQKMTIELCCIICVLLHATPVTLCMLNVVTSRIKQRCRHALCRHGCGRPCPSSCRGSYFTAPRVHNGQPPDARKHVRGLCVIFGRFFVWWPWPLNFWAETWHTGYSCPGDIHTNIGLSTHSRFWAKSPYATDRQTDRRTGKTRCGNAAY